MFIVQDSHDNVYWYVCTAILNLPTILCTKGYSSVCACDDCQNLQMLGVQPRAYVYGTERKSIDCNHQWKAYVGLTETYNYCTICDKKELQ